MTLIKDLLTKGQAELGQEKVDLIPRLHEGKYLDCSHQLSNKIQPELLFSICVTFTLFLKDNNYSTLNQKLKTIWNLFEPFEYLESIQNNRIEERVALL